MSPSKKRVERHQSTNEASGFASSQTVHVPKTKVSQRGRKLVQKMNSNATDDGKLPEIHASPAARNEAEMKERLAFKQPVPKRKKVKKTASERPDDEF